MCALIEPHQKIVFLFFFLFFFYFIFGCEAFCTVRVLLPINSASFTILISFLGDIFAEHIWQVTMQKKGLGERKNIYGPYRLCLTDRKLSLVKIGTKDISDPIEFSVSILLILRNTLERRDTIILILMSNREMNYFLHNSKYVFFFFYLTVLIIDAMMVIISSRNYFSKTKLIKLTIKNFVEVFFRLLCVTLNLIAPSTK